MIYKHKHGSRTKLNKIYEKDLMTATIFTDSPAFFYTIDNDKLCDKLQYYVIQDM